jgi:hypothetical protein
MPSDHDTEAVSSKVFMTVRAFPPSPCRLAAHVRMSFRHDDLVVLRPRTAGIFLQRRSSCESSQRESYGQNHHATDTSNHFLPCSHRHVTSLSIIFLFRLLPEAAVPTGLPKAPSAYSPFTHFDKARQRQAYVLERREEDGYITHQDWE